MVADYYIPQKGDLIWLNFTPQSGHEQAGKRPAIVISPLEYNKKSGLIIVCPVTSKQKGYPFEVNIVSKKIHGVVLADQVKSLDWQTRHAEFIEKIDQQTMKEVQDKLIVLID